MFNFFVFPVSSRVQMAKRVAGGLLGSRVAGGFIGDIHLRKIDVLVDVQWAEVVDAEVSVRYKACSESGDIDLIKEKFSSFIVTKRANGSSLVVIGLSSSGVDALDEGGDFLGPLVKKSFSVLKLEAFEFLEAARFDIWKVEVEVQDLAGTCLDSWI